MGEMHSATDGLAYLKWSRKLFRTLAPYIFERGLAFASRVSDLSGAAQERVQAALLEAREGSKKF